MTIHILIAVDGSERSPALIEAAHGLFGDHADYTVLTVGSVAPYTAAVSPLGAAPALMWLTADATEPVETARAAAEASLEASDLAGTDVTVVADAGAPGPAICALATSTRADALVVGGHERGWLSRLIEPSVARDVIDHAPCPVVVVPQA